MKRPFLDSLLIALVAVTMFARVSDAYFCGFDDFGETHRAAFEDAGQPSRIFTTTHFGSTKYRPLNRLSTYVCWKLGGGSALPFRGRNLFFHLACALLVYGIAWFWTRDRNTCLAASLFFCLLPAANQTVVAAIFTNTTAYALLLASFLLFLYWLELGRGYLLAASMFLVLIGLFFYEPIIVVFAMMFGYILLLTWKQHVPPRPQMITFLVSSAVVLLVFASVRHFIVHGETPRVPLRTILLNTGMYVGALVTPVDPLLANRLFGAPLPPEVHFQWHSLLWLSLIPLALAGLTFAVLRTRSVQAGLARLDKGLAIFLIFCIFAVLMPFLMFTPHASETYLYLPAAIYAILLSLILRAFLSSNLTYAVFTSILLLSFCCGTWLRNQRVAACGQVAEHILEQLPVDVWKSGENKIRLANDSGQIPQHHYGIYLYSGLSTIERGDPGDAPATMYALQLVTKNPKLTVEVVGPADFRNSCTLPHTCFLVYGDGTVREIVSSSSN
jgi:hypothetical protein